MAFILVFNNVVDDIGDAGNETGHNTLSSRKSFAKFRLSMFRKTIFAPIWKR